uniref:Saposin B-type domain-containing protein n=1 Tax=Hanusia phi TaxID=3032 RepID=A0A7S0F464_9CRYP|mmetsp:Transcript_4035/g.9823  ORF Transcript_4035/g.9823 Transcript_4035/m.9823 type:complete len:190 (+) Transcript_4035:128-697(+)
MMMGKWIFLVLSVCVLLASFSVVDGKKKKVKTTYKALKCSACKAVADEMKREVEHEWQTRAGETILIEKRKKKTKVPYIESELSVQEAVDRVCTMDHLFDKYNVTSVGGKPEYTRMEMSVGNKEYKNQLLAMCQSLIAEHEHDIVKFFFDSRTSGSLQSNKKSICSEIAKICSPTEFDVKETAGDTKEL